MCLPPLAGVSAAKGGNSGNVTRCLEGGWADLYNANTGRLFSNQGACIAYGARGQAYALLEVEANTYDNGVFTVWSKSADGWDTPAPDSP